MHKQIVMLLVTLSAVGFGSAHAVSKYFTPAAARAIVEDYYQMIDAKHFLAAYQLWSASGSASGKTYTRFRQGFAQTEHTRVVTGEPVNNDAAMGSVYVDVPVEVFATLKNGHHQRFRGYYTLRRVNDVDGASNAQLHWHLASSSLKAE